MSYRRLNRWARGSSRSTSSCSAASSSCSAALSRAVSLRRAATSNRHHRCRMTHIHTAAATTTQPRRSRVRDDGCQDGNAHAGQDRMPLGARSPLHVLTLTAVEHHELTPSTRFGNRQSLHAGGDGGRSRKRRVRRRGRSGAHRRRGVIRARNLSALYSLSIPVRYDNQRTPSSA